jgi:hypothetical protein
VTSKLTDNQKRVDPQLTCELIDKRHSLRGAQPLCLADRALRAGGATLAATQSADVRGTTNLPIQAGEQVGEQTVEVTPVVVEVGE